MYIHTYYTYKSTFQWFALILKTGACFDGLLLTLIDISINNVNFYIYKTPADTPKRINTYVCM